MSVDLRRLLIARAPYSDSRSTIRVYVMYWAIFVVGIAAVAAVQLSGHLLPDVPAAFGRYGPSVIGVTIGLGLAALVNVVVNRRRHRHG